MGLFGDCVEVTAYNDGELDLSKMITDTVFEPMSRFSTN